MRAFLLGMVLAAGAALLPREAAAQTQLSSRCSDDGGVDRCDAEVQRRVRELFGVPPIEELQASGAQVRRAFYVDGYGRDMVAISFVRAPGSDPTLFVNFPREGETLPPPATALIPTGTWERVLSGSAHFDQALASDQAAVDSDTIALCLHGRVYTIEAADPPTDRASPRIRREVENGCEDGLAEPYAGELAELALPLLPYCAVLDRTQHRDSVSALRACAMLSGDRMAAAKALNTAMRLVRVDRPDDAVLGQGVFDWGAELDWAGERLGGDGDQAYGAWIERTTGSNRANFYLLRAVGESSRRVRVEGVLSKLVERPGGRSVYEEAPVILLFESQFSWAEPLVERASVGRFAAVPDS